MSQNSFEKKNDFASRHIGFSPHDQTSVLKAVRAESLEKLIAETIPEEIRLNKDLNISRGISENELLERLEKISQKNCRFKNYIGFGFHETIVPPVILRSIFCNPGWYTAYTPYQAEISQGRLEALLNFQTMIGDLTGMQIANASLLDEASACAEAMMMMFRIVKRKRKDSGKFFIDSGVFETSQDVMITRAKHLGVETVIGKITDFDFDPDFFGVMLQNPDKYGRVHDYSDWIGRLKKEQIMVSMAADLMSLALLKSPGEQGADICIGTSQRFGVPLGYGGPHAAFIAGASEHSREMPGRIIGVSIDKQGDKAYRMALQTREQHIKKERATSNICTAQALLAIMAGMYAVYHGPDGLRNIAASIHHKTKLLNDFLVSKGFKTDNAEDFFDTLCLSLESPEAEKIKAAALNKKVNLNYFYEGKILLSLSEKTTIKDLNELGEILTGSKPGFKNEESFSIRSKFLRQDSFLTHPVFNSYNTETEISRYIKELESKDLTLRDAMIPLGSCTMKLNSVASLLPVSFPGFAEIHPFAPSAQTQAYQEIITELNKDLCEITGFDQISFQPNSGAQGEYAGLLTVKAYLESKGEHQRNVILIPVSAHGTNAASASMAGMKVVAVRCDKHGNTDFDELVKKAEQFSEELAGIMITYPSTHGVFEDKIHKICEVIHENGGQVYMDGANMNAQVGLTSPGFIGADVCHLNLHKTFSIPHGGGGPGVGPIGVKKHLIPYLPEHRIVSGKFREKVSYAVSNTCYGSASILPVTYSYIKMLGGEGLKDSTEMAVLSANYIKSRLEEYFPVVYQGKSKRVAHELIIDVRQWKKEAGIEAVDVAKRLMDYGFHAPTLSFPIAGTLMIEPTESESKKEVDRFCNAMIQIYNEIQEILGGQADRENNLLKNAPHSLSVATSDDWPHPYSREKALYPLPELKKRKFWPSVSRIDDAYGDRNLICSCPSFETELD